MTGAVETTCPYCGVGCGLVVSEARSGRVVGGDPAHPANGGRLCSKGAALMETVEGEAPGTRLLHPEIEGRRAGWDEALAATAGRLKETVERHGPESVAFYVSGQLLTEDYYVANKLLKGFIGSPHIDTNSRLCMASTVAGHKRAFGADAVPGCYEDLELADLVVLVGSNLSWCHPVLARRLSAARRDRGTRVVVVDPRRTASCDDADLHLALKPGTDTALFNGLLAHLAREGAVDRGYVAAGFEGFEAALAAAVADAPDIPATAAACGLAPDDVARFFGWFAGTPRTVTVFSQGVNQSSRGTDKVNAILNAHLATGRVGRPGATPFSVTGQPNAMGGREVGGLANQLAAHMDPNDPADVERLRRFWKAPALRGGEGLKAVDMFRAVEEGRIKAVWVMATNPAVSLPEADRVRLALARCPTVIVSDVVADGDTLRFAHIRLPAAAWGEKAGTVTNSERRISRQRPFRAPPGEARPDWWIMTGVAKAMGFGPAFRYRRPADIYREHAALSAFENGDGKGRARIFDIGAHAGLSDAAYEGLKPFQWPLPAGAKEGTARLYGDGRFTTPSGRARMVAVTAGAPVERPSIRFPLVANSGRYRDQWHTMTRTGLSARLSAHRPEPLVEISPADAQIHGMAEGGLARVASAWGDMLLRVHVTDAQPQGQVFVPIHWSDATAARAVGGRLLPGHVDPLSGQPESKYVPVRVEPWVPAWNGVLLARAAPDLSGIPYWVRQAGGDCAVFELAGDDPVQAEALVDRLAPAGGGHRQDYRDDRHGVLRHAWLSDDRLEACLFVGRDRPEVARPWLRGLFGPAGLEAGQRAVLLAGLAPKAGCGGGRLVCSCFMVDSAMIGAAIEVVLREGAAVTAEEIGRRLKAGTGCGSCLSEIKEILCHAKPAFAA